MVSNINLHLYTKGLALAGLGSFAVGLCQDSYGGGMTSQRCPTFSFNEKFASVSQHKGRYFLAGPVTYSRINFHSVAGKVGRCASC